MRIGIHADAVSHAVPGGIGAYVAHLFENLLALGHDDEFLALISRSGRSPTPRLPPERVVRSRLGVRWLYPAWNYLSLPRVGHNLDVVHATAMVVPPAPGVPLVATVHDFAVERFPEVVPAPWRQLYRRGLRRVLDQAAVICANSQATRAEVLDRRPDADVVVTPLAPAVDPGTAPEPAILTRLGLASPFILCVGTIEPRKNQTGLVEAFSRVASRLADHRLVLAGAPGWDAGRTRAAIDGHRLGGRVVVTGRISDGELAALYASAHAVALPSRYEGFGIPLVEALAFGIPALAGDVPALREVAGDAAVFVDADRIDDMADTLVALCHDGTLRARLSSAGIERSRSFTWRATAMATRDAYQRAAERR